MKFLPFLLFAASATISIVDVGGTPGGCLGVQLSSLWSGNSVRFKPDIIEWALGTVDTNIQFRELFEKILSEVKIKNLDTCDAAGFLQRIAHEVDKTFVPYFNIVETIVEVYCMFKLFQPLDGDGLQKLIQKHLDAILSEQTKQEKHFLSEKIAPMISRLILNSSDKAVGIAHEIVDTLWTNNLIQNEISELFDGAVPINGTAYSYVMKAIKSTK